MKAMATLFTLALALSTATQARAVEGQKVIKIAIVAPKGSVWMRTWDQLTARLLKDSGGKVRLQYYPGMVQGDERDVVRKMRTGQLQGGAFTHTGLSMVNPKVLVLQMPTIFANHKQIDNVRERLKKEIAESFLEKGFVLLGWADVGFFHVFSKNPVRSLADLRKQKLWVWTDDQATKALVRKLGESPRMLNLPQVYSGLSTGMVDAVTVSPIGLMTMQWQSFVKYMTTQPLYYAVGATVITKKSFDALTADEQKLLTDLAERYHRLAMKRVRRSNKKGLETLKKHGLKEVTFDDASWKKIKKAGAAVTKSFSPRYFPKSLLDKVLKAR
jgi:TRAP-type C4-dicarboxylate transport system substrate-binding protein